MPGMGTQAGALQKVNMAVDLLQQALPALGTGSEHHRAVLKAVTDLSRHMAQGQPTAGTQQTALQDMQRANRRNAIMQRVMAQRGGMPGGPVPSTPLPGA